MKSLIASRLLRGCCLLAAAACSSTPPGRGGPAASGGSGGSPASGGSGGGASASGGTGGTAGPAGGGAGGETTASPDARSGSGGTSPDGGAPVTVDAGSGAPEPGPSTPSAHAFRVTGVATWRGNATAAYSIIHDDLCDPSVNGIFNHVDPLMVERKMHGGFGAIVNRCNTFKRWDDVKALLAHGHDVFDHSWEHPCLTASNGLAESCDPAAPRSTNFDVEIDQSTKVLHEQLGVPIEFFIAPYDVCDPAAVARLKTAGYLGARCGNQSTQFNASDFPDPFRLQFDVWGPAYSHYGPAFGAGGVCAGVKEFVTPPAQAPAACRTHILRQYVDDTITRKGWALHEFHGFEDDGAKAFEPLPVDEYRAHLDYVAGKVRDGALWVEGPTRVLRYRFARGNCGQPTVTGSTLSFAAPTADCSRYATVVSYLVSTSDGSDPTSLAVRQGGKLLPARRLAPGSYAVDADPTQGDAVIVE